MPNDIDSRRDNVAATTGATTATGKTAQNLTAARAARWNELLAAHLRISTALEAPLSRRPILFTEPDA